MTITNLKLQAEKNRKRLIEVICAAKAGHTGGDLSVLNLLTVLYHHTMNISAQLLDNPDRDLFVLSKGHCVEALFVVLESMGILDKKTLDTLGGFNSPLAGHPTSDIPGIEANSGALGHGLPIAAGMALASKMDNKGNRVFVVMGDGEQEEGSIYEAAMVGSHYRLDNLAAFIDRNRLQISGSTEDVIGYGKIDEIWNAFGWDVLEMNGDDIEEIVRTLDGIDWHNGRPHMIIANTTKGYGISFMENIAKWHHGVPTPEQAAAAISEIEARIAALS